MDKTLKRLRYRLTLLNALVAGAILASLLCATMMFSIGQLARGAQNAFAYAANTIAHDLSAETAISHRYLRDAELAQDMVIYIEDNGTALMWKGAYQTKTSRDILISRARAIALDNALPLDYAPIAPHNCVSVISGDNGDDYRVSAWVLPDGSDYLTIFMIKDREAENREQTLVKLIFLCATLAGVFVQLLFGYFFAGKVIRPIAIAENNQRAFVQSASHELRTPLAVIGASAEAIPLAKPDEAIAFSKSIRDQSRRMARLVDDLMLLASADAQTLPLRCAPVETASLTEEAARAFKPLMDEKEISLDCVGAENVIVWADEARLHQALCVLLDNALEYTPRGGIVRLSCKRNGRGVDICVEDNGPGILDADKENIFRRFYRADKTCNRQKSHYGLGLCVANEIIKGHGGALSVHDSAFGGALFLIRLPLDTRRSCF